VAVDVVLVKVEPLKDKNRYGIKIPLQEGEQVLDEV